MNENIIYARWYNSNSNWGDVLNEALINAISGRQVHHLGLNEGGSVLKYIVIGSILQWSDENTIVWGAGLLDGTITLEKKPLKICAVRGPKTRDALLKQGVDCPEVYGDPALLYPRFYNPSKIKKYKVGIIPHYVDKENPWLNNFKNNEDILIIDILGNINKVVDEICSCEVILSSSLHGIIASDAYGIPSIWIEPSDNVLGKGFKFKDYFMSVRRSERKPVIVNKNTILEEITGKLNHYQIDIDLDKLYLACPFRNI